MQGIGWPGDRRAQKPTEDIEATPRLETAERDF